MKKAIAKNFFINILERYSKSTLTKILIVTLLFFISYRKGQTKKTLEDMNKSKIVYYLDYNLGLSFELYVNGIKLDGGNGESTVLDYQVINPFIHSGINTISLKLEPKKEEKLDSGLLDQIVLDLYAGNPAKEEEIIRVKQFKLPEQKKISNQKVQTWKFKSDVPFTFGKLSKAARLSDVEHKKLLSKVLNTYEEFRRIINNGNADEYLRRFKGSNNRKMRSMYYNEQKQAQYLEKLSRRVMASKGHMQPLKDYHLEVHLNNKIVTLENSEGNTPLYSKDNQGNIKTYGLMLYMPKDSDKLEVY